MPRRGTLLRSGQYANCAKRYSVSSFRVKSWALCRARMRVNAQEEKRKHGITCCMSRPLEKGRAEGAGWMCLEEAPFYAAVSMTTVQSATPYRHFERQREIFVMRGRGLAVDVWKSQTGNLLSTYLQASPHIYGGETATASLKAGDEWLGIRDWGLGVTSDW